MFSLSLRQPGQGSEKLVIYGWGGLIGLIISSCPGCILLLIQPSAMSLVISRGSAILGKSYHQTGTCLVVKSLTQPYELLKLSLDKWVSELQGLSTECVTRMVGDLVHFVPY